MEDNMMFFCHNTCTHNHEGTLIYPGETMSSPLPLPGLLDKCFPSNTKSSQLLNSLQSLRPQPRYHCLPFSHAGGAPQETLCSEREEWFKRQSCLPQCASTTDMEDTMMLFCHNA